MVIGVQREALLQAHRGPDAACCEAPFRVAKQQGRRFLPRTSHRLLDHEDWEAIVEEVYASRFISIKAFAHDGGLRGLLRVCLAHQLMYYGAMAKLFYAIENCAGKRLLKILSDSTTFRKARERVRRTDTVHQHLLDISSKLMASFRSANDKPPEDASLIELARAQSAGAAEAVGGGQESV